MNDETTNESMQDAFNEDPSLQSDSGMTMPLGTGDINDQAGIDVLAGASSGRKFSAGSLVLVLVIAVACVGLWFMRSLSKVSASSVGNEDLDASIEKFIQGYKGKGEGSESQLLTSENPDVIKVISETYTDRQVALDNVQRNPFIIYGDVTVETTQPVNTTNNKSYLQAKRKEEIEKAAQSFELKSVIISSNPKAIVNGKIVQVGDDLVSDNGNVTFRVTKIDTESVSIVAEDSSVGLKIPVTLMLKRAR